MNIEKTETVYLDGEEFVRVYFADQEEFSDVPVDDFAEWKDLVTMYKIK